MGTFLRYRGLGIYQSRDYTRRICRAKHRSACWQLLVSRIRVDTSGSPELYDFLQSLLV